MPTPGDNQQALLDACVKEFMELKEEVEALDAKNLNFNMKLQALSPHMKVKFSERIDELTSADGQ